jgi:predicted HicB family RNase H-like nuclease
MNKTIEEDRILHIRVASDMHRKLRVEAAKQDISVTELVVELLKLGLKTQKQEE